MPTPKLSSLDDFGDDDLTQWENIALRYKAPLTGFFAKRVSPRDDVDDLVQEVFLRLIQRGNGQPIESMEKYLFQSAANVLRDRYRRQQTRDHDMHESYEDFKYSGSEITPERVLIGKETVSQVVAALDDLPMRTRDVFVLRGFEKYKYTEIARMMNISTRTVEKHMAKALAYLGHALDRCEDQ